MTKPFKFQVPLTALLCSCGLAVLFAVLAWQDVNRQAGVSQGAGYVQDSMRQDAKPLSIDAVQPRSPLIGPGDAAGGSSGYDGIGRQDAAPLTRVGSEYSQREQHGVWVKWAVVWLAIQVLMALMFFAGRYGQKHQGLHADALVAAPTKEPAPAKELLELVAWAQAAFIETDDQRASFNALLSRILAHTGSSFGFIGEVLRDSHHAPYLRTYAISNIAWDQASADFYAEHAGQGLEFHNLHSLLGCVVRDAAPVISNAPSEDSRRGGVPLGHPPLDTFAGLPLFANGQLVGMLGMANRPNGYADDVAEQLKPLLATLGQLVEALRRDVQRESAQQHLQRQQQALRALNQIAALKHLDSQQQLCAALQLGAEFYGTPLGLISRVVGEDYQVLAQFSPPDTLQDGQHFNLGETFCSLTLNGRDVLAIDHMGASEFAHHPCYPSFRLETYIGAVVQVGGRPFGTLAFCSAEPRAVPFDETELEFLRLFARWVGATLESQQQEQARQALLQRLDESQRIARLGHWEANLEDGSLYWSAPVYEIFGLDPATFIPSVEGFKRYVHPDDLALVEASEARVSEEGLHNVRHRIIRPDGEVRWVQELARLQPNEEGYFVRLVGTVQDVTEQASAEATLKSQGERLQSIIEGTHIGTWEWNVQTGATVFNERWAEIIGYSLDELAPVDINTWLSHAHPDDLDQSAALLHAHFRGDAPYYDCQCRMRHRDGHWVWVHDRGRVVSRSADGQPLMMFGTHADITEMRAQQEAVDQARASLQTVLDSATGVSVIATNPLGKITLFNHGAERLLGYMADEIVGLQTLALLHFGEEIELRSRELSQQHEKPIRGLEVLFHQARSGEPETRQWAYQCKDGSSRQVNLTVSAMFDKHEQITGFLCIASDISELQATTRSLQKSESRFRGLVANLPGMVYRCDNDADWTMRYMSDEVLQLTGYPASDFINNRVRAYASVIHPDDLHITYESIPAIERQETFELTYRLQHLAGHSVWVREKGRGEYDSNGALLWVSGFVWDISDRKAAEDALRVSEQRFSGAFNTAPQGMAMVGLDGRWLEVNDALCLMLGYSRAELQQLDFQHITHPDDLQTDLQLLQRLLKGEINDYQLEKRYLDKQGRVLWILLSVSLVRDAQGQPLYFVSQIQNFSERVEAEKAVREREEYLSTLLDNVIDAIITFNEQGLIETFNPAAEHIFGCQLEDVLGRHIKLLVPADSPAVEGEYLSRHVHNHVTANLGDVVELAAQRFNGESFIMELAVSQITYQGARRFIAVIRDISERKRIEQMKSEFVSTVSHELRTPLTAIAGALGLINGGALGAVPGAMQDMLRIAQNNSLRLGDLINDLLDMDKLIAGKMTFDIRPHALQALLEAAIEQNQPYAEQFHVHLQLVTAASDLQVSVDSQRLGQVLANLLSNAAKFSPQGSHVDVAVVSLDGRARISVRDLGAGIPQVFRSRIFSKFSQADSTDTRQKGGTGLGLAISKQLIENMGGQIGFESSENQGSTFWIELPLLARS